MDYNKKKRRRTKSVQDMYGIGLDTRPSSRASSSARTMSYSNYTYKGDNGGSNGGIGLTIFGGLLVVAIIVSCVFYYLNSNKEPFVYPTDVLTISGVLTDIYGGQTTAAVGDVAADAGAETTDPATMGQTTEPGTTDPAAVNPAGAATSAYPEATSHEELLTQIDSALAAGDTSFITTKFLCKDTEGSYIGYSIETINAFVAYMMANPDKRAAFIASVADANVYSTLNQEVYYLTLPKIVFSINIGYADTTVSTSTFPDVVVDGTETLEQGPLLPMIYKFTVSNATWKEPASQDIEVTLDKAVIGINIGQ